MSIRTETTVDDLYRVPEHGKAELVNGKLVLMSTDLISGHSDPEGVARGTLYDPFRVRG